jgi:hypothetical protein
MAKLGDVGALKICVDKLLPNARERPCKFVLPKLKTSGDAIEALGLIADGLASGQLLPFEAEALCNVVTSFTRTIELTSMEDRLAELERGRAEDLASRGTHYDA